MSTEATNRREYPQVIFLRDIKKLEDGDLDLMSLIFGFLEGARRKFQASDMGVILSGEGLIAQFKIATIDRLTAFRAVSLYAEFMMWEEVQRQIGEHAQNN